MQLPVPAVHPIPQDTADHQGMSHGVPPHKSPFQPVYPIPKGCMKRQGISHVVPQHNSLSHLCIRSLSSKRNVMNIMERGMELLNTTFCPPFCIHKVYVCSDIVCQSSPSPRFQLKIFMGQEQWCPSTQYFIPSCHVCYLAWNKCNRRYLIINTRPFAER